MNAYFAEFLGTTLLVLMGNGVVANVVLSKTKGNDPMIQLSDTQETPIGLGSVGAIRVALIVFAIGLSLGGTTGYAINPARDLGPRIAHALLPISGKGTSDWAYAAVPVAGPIIGAMLAALLYGAA